MVFIVEHSDYEGVKKVGIVSIHDDIIKADCQGIDFPDSIVMAVWWWTRVRKDTGRLIMALLDNEWCGSNI